MTTIAERLRVYGQPDMRGEDSITWQAADALDAAEKALDELLERGIDVSHTALCLARSAAVAEAKIERAQAALSNLRGTK